MDERKSPSIMVIAGEESGDLHGSHLLNKLKAIIPGLKMSGIGGDRMRMEGMELIYHYRDLSVVGFTEVVRLLPRLWRIMRHMEDLVRVNRPDAVILIDYPGFNIRLARRVHALGVKVFYYISPQVWAWGKKRIPLLAEIVDGMAVILPFEPEVYRHTSLPVTFVGHPLLDTARQKYSKDEFFKKHNLSRNSQLIGLLPGSRRQELNRLLSPMLSTLKLIRAQIPDIQAVIGAAATLEDEQFIPYLRQSEAPRLIRDEIYDVMAHADLIITASGTATLETAIMQCPMIIVYKASFLTYKLAKMIVKISRAGLVNIVAGKDIVPEYIQHELVPVRIADDAVDLLTNQERNKSIRTELARVKASLGDPGASERTAELIKALINS